MMRKVRQKQIAADPGHDGRNIPFHARHIAHGHAEAHESGRIVHMHVGQIRRRAGHSLEIFMAGAKVRMRAQVVIALTFLGNISVAPQQDCAG
jgi:hypothetical protein